MVTSKRAGCIGAGNSASNNRDASQHLNQHTPHGVAGQMVRIDFVPVQICMRYDRGPCHAHHKVTALDKIECHDNKPVVRDMLNI